MGLLLFIRDVAGFQCALHVPDASSELSALGGGSHSALPRGAADQVADPNHAIHEAAGERRQPESPPESLASPRIACSTTYFPMRTQLLVSNALGHCDYDTPRDHGLIADTCHSSVRRLRMPAPPNDTSTNSPARDTFSPFPVQLFGWRLHLPRLPLAVLHHSF